MLRTPVVPLFFAYSIPWTLSMLTLSSAGLVDGIFIGQYVGPLALAAVNIIWPVYSLVMGVGIALAAGGGVRCAAYFAKGENAKAQGIFTNCLLFMLLFSLCVMPPCFFYAENIVHMLGADDTIRDDALSYFHIATYFFPILCVGLVLSFFLRVDERPTLAALGYVLTAAVNMLLDYLFIVQFGWGIRGAALATGLGYTSMFIFHIWGYWFTKTPRRLALIPSRTQWREVFTAIWNGISEMISEMSTGIVLIIINVAMMRMAGAQGVAAFTIVNYLNWVCLILCFGFADSLSPLVSANYAKMQASRVRALLKVALVTVTTVGLTCFTLMSLFPHELIALFLPDGQNTHSSRVAEDFMSISRFLFLFCGANIVLTAYLTGLLQAAASALVALLRSLILPFLLVSTLPLLWDYKGVALALPVAELITLTVALFLCRRLAPQKSTRHHIDGS